MISALTTEEADLLPQWKEEWLQKGLSTGPPNRAEVMSAINAAYRLIDRPVPIILYTPSPLSSIKWIESLRHVGSLGYSLWGSLRASMAQSMYESLQKSLRESMGESLYGSLRSSLWDSLGKSLQDSLWYSLGSSLLDSLQTFLDTYLSGSLLNECWCHGTTESYWISYYRFCQRIGVNYTSHSLRMLNIWDKLLQCGYVWSYDNFTIVSERPSILRTEVRNDRHVLHCIDGPSMAYPDGYSIWAWHGVRVPQRIIEDHESITVSDIISEKNAEVSRVMLERYGQDRFIIDANASTIDKQGDNELVYIPLESDPEKQIVALKLRCPSTAALYIIRVPPDQTSVEGALAWTWDFRPGEWELAMET